MTATIDDVVQECGVDHKTAERILEAGLLGLNPEDVRKVLSSASSLGVRPKPRNLGIIYAEESGRGLTHPFFVLILEAFKKEAQSKGYDVTFINQSADPDDSSYLQHCTDGRVGGLCMVCADYDSPRIHSLIASGIPCVTVDHMFRRVPAILSDNETGVRKLVEYAINRGHRKIAYIHGHNNSVVTRTRISQFNSVMEYYNIPVPPQYLREGLYDDIQLTRNLVLELLSLPDRPTCILLPDDIAYLGAQEAAIQLGLSIPNDISFGGYDGIPLTQTLSPRLTTIRQSTDLMGRTAAERLINLIENPQPKDKRPIVFPVELIEGETIGELIG